MRTETNQALQFGAETVVVAIIHYNTPELTHACIGSLLHNGGLGTKLRVVLFDNSDERPFPESSGITVVDNTKGQVIDFNAELEKFPQRDRSIGCAKGCEFGSVKHMMTVQKLWELLPQGFILMESDVLITQSIADFVKPEYSFVGYCQKAQPHNPFQIGRILPMLCYMNVPLLTKYGARFYDPTRTYGLLPGGRGNKNNWYDTGAVLLEDIIAKRPNLKGLHQDIRPYVVHYGSASWQKNDKEAHLRWIESHSNLFPNTAAAKEAIEQWHQAIAEERAKFTKPTGVAICAIVRNENRYLKEWTESHFSLGVEKIYIYDNGHGDDDNPADVLDDERIEIISWRDRGGNVQCEAYDECYRLHNSEHGWIGFIDIDEFVRSGVELSELLNGLQADVVAFSWRMMTDNGLVYYEDKPVQERFTQPAEDLKPKTQFVKSFVRGGIKGLSFDQDPHMPHRPVLAVVNPNGEKAPQCSVGTGSREIAWIDHHFTKTAEEFVAKVKRSWPAIQDERIIEKKKNAVNHFFRFNERTPEKEIVLGIRQPDQKQPEPTSKPKTAKRPNKKVK